MKNFLTIFLLMVLFTSCTKQDKTENVTTRVINELPHLKFTSLDGTIKSTRDLPTPLILVLFNADCDHCQRQAQEVGKHLNEVSNITLQFIAADDLPTIQKFATEYGLNNQPNLNFGRADATDVYMNFGSIPTPAIYLYSADKRLLKNFKGETPVAELVAPFR
ncbi:MAG: redoxin domain-containing protein [Cyclobacteriaceae bacterium]|nr:redoxin domain-containing protein [Cyclobacteriaceae bacterium]